MIAVLYKDKNAIYSNTERNTVQLELSTTVLFLLHAHQHRLNVIIFVLQASNNHHFVIAAHTKDVNVLTKTFTETSSVLMAN